MILRIDRLQTELPPPSDPDPEGSRRRPGAAGGEVRRDVHVAELHVPVVQLPEPSRRPSVLRPAVQHRDRGVRPCRARLGDDQHDADRGDADRRRRAPDGAGRLKGIGNPHHFLAGGQGSLPQNSQGRPWNGDYVFSSGDLVEGLTHNFFLETGGTNNKLKVYEMVEHPAARALTGYLLVRGGVHQVAYARALERLTGRRPDEAVSLAADPHGQAPRVPATYRTSRAPQALPLLRGGVRRRSARCSTGRILRPARTS